MHLNLVTGLSSTDTETEIVFLFIVFFSIWSQ
jgi:hypothetical protein